MHRRRRVEKERCEELTPRGVRGKYGPGAALLPRHPPHFCSAVYILANMNFGVTGSADGGTQFLSQRVCGDFCQLSELFLRFWIE